MSFDERNAAWAGGLREFRQLNSRTSAPRVWRIRTEGNKIIYDWGQLGGAMQTASEISQGVNLGKKNAMSPEVYALDRAREMCRKKHWEGYREFDANGNRIDPEEVSSIDFNQLLPLNLSFYKPLNTAGSLLLKKAERGEALYTRKFNGMMHALVCDAKGKVQIYSRRMLIQHDDESQTRFTWNDRFPHIAAAAQKIMPAKSILLGEMVAMPNGPQGVEDFKAIQSYTKSLTPQSLEDQKKGPPVLFCVWDVAFWEGEDLVSKAPVGDRYDIIHEIDYSGTFGHVFPLHIYPPGFFKNPDEAVKAAKSSGIEGYVVVDPKGVYGDRAYNFKGKPDRPGTFCAKLKPSYEDDFVAMWDPNRGYGERSNKGRYAGGIKSVALFQYNSKGDFVFISNLNSGLSEQQKKDWANPSLYPMVWKVEYKERAYQSEGDDSNALTFASYLEPRTDKKPNECVNPNL